MLTNSLNSFLCFLFLQGHLSFASYPITSYNEARLHSLLPGKYLHANSVNQTIFSPYQLVISLFNKRNINVLEYSHQTFINLGALKYHPDSHQFIKVRSSVLAEFCKFKMHCIFYIFFLSYPSIDFFWSLKSTIKVSFIINRSYSFIHL